MSQFCPSGFSQEDVLDLYKSRDRALVVNRWGWELSSSIDRSNAPRENRHERPTLHQGSTVKLVLLIYNDKALLDGLPAGEFDSRMRYCAWRMPTTSGTKASCSTRRYSGRRPRPKSVRIRNGRQLTTDGPFAETKEMIAGFNIIEADSMDEAVRIGTAWPWAQTGCVEVRPTSTSPTCGRRSGRHPREDPCRADSARSSRERKYHRQHRHGDRENDRVDRQPKLPKIRKPIAAGTQDQRVVLMPEWRQEIARRADRDGHQERGAIDADVLCDTVSDGPHEQHRRRIVQDRRDGHGRHEHEREHRMRRQAAGYGDEAVGRELGRPGRFERPGYGNQRREQHDHGPLDRRDVARRHEPEGDHGGRAKDEGDRSGRHAENDERDGADEHRERQQHSARRQASFRSARGRQPIFATTSGKSPAGPSSNSTSPGCNGTSRNRVVIGLPRWRSRGGSCRTRAQPQVRAVLPCTHDVGVTTASAVSSEGRVGGVSYLRAGRLRSRRHGRLADGRSGGA